MLTQPKVLVAEVPDRRTLKLSVKNFSKMDFTMQHDIEFNEGKNIEHQKLKPLRILEIYLWVFIAMATGGRVTYLLYSRPFDAGTILQEFYWEIIAAGLVLIFPIFFRLIFGLLPLEFVRFSRQQKIRPSVINIGGDYVVSASENSSFEPTQAGGAPAASSLTGKDLLLNHAANSRNLAKGIYGRSGVYLLVGVLVAFSGLAFFYSQTVGLAQPTEANTLFFSLAPKFGILFFIEFVAFFFLRQYRSAMDEFRYYEAIARKREEVSALLEVAKDLGASVELMELIKHESYFSKTSVINKDQTTEIIESRKMEKSEIDLLEKIVETLARAKK
ncbi:hypothetical protein [Pseudomonas sp. zfem002]|uniref:hypothetical protein n=1 Tax=Pseudomonas sp. zfem002 TaxID=3078197 RepID=UPI00292974E4|nr:hypothetical protein [Pseudomonas sp. zfem002]MDU9394712.1 hypothetical protein [Pseudomonas sp. zfem002]